MWRTSRTALSRDGLTVDAALASVTYAAAALVLAEIVVGTRSIARPASSRTMLATDRVPALRLPEEAAGDIVAKAGRGASLSTRLPSRMRRAASPRITRFMTDYDIRSEVMRTSGGRRGPRPRWIGETLDKCTSPRRRCFSCAERSGLPCLFSCPKWYGAVCGEEERPRCGAASAGGT